MSHSNDPKRFNALSIRGLFSSRRKRSASMKERAAESKAEPLNGYPETKAEQSYKFTVSGEDVQISIVRNSSMEPYVKAFYCGYVRFPRTMFQSELFARFVPVHGGISFDHADTDGSHVYGFDCSHAGDDVLPGAGGQTWDLQRVKAECERLATAVSVSSKWEKDFLSFPESAEWRDRRIGSIERCHSELRKKGIVFSLTDNFGAMIEVLFGGLAETEEGQ